jgi:hypothetical protein
MLPRPTQDEIRRMRASLRPGPCPMESPESSPPPLPPEWYAVKGGIGTCPTRPPSAPGECTDPFDRSTRSTPTPLHDSGVGPDAPGSGGADDAGGAV